MTTVDCYFVAVPEDAAVSTRCFAQFGRCHRTMVFE